MELTPDEAVRMSLLFSEQSRNPKQVLSLVSNNLKTTKGFVGDANPVIVDSMLFGSATKASDGPMVLYVVSNGSDQGYTIVNKDNRLAPIVGYSESGDYNTKERNPALDIILRNVVAYQAHLLDSLENLRGDQVYSDLQNKLGIAQGPATRILYEEDGPPDNRPTVPWDRYEVVEEASWQTQDYVDGPLLKTRWGQGNPYNSLLPTNCPTGCTATSAAQIMAYYKYPKYSPITGQEYLWNSYPTQTYDWPTEQKFNIGRLMVDLGSKSCLNMQYVAIDFYPFEKYYLGSFPGSLNCTNTPRTFEIFGYYGGAHKRYSYEAIVPDISAKRPVHVCGLKLIGWHTWVLDGAKHCSNWRRAATKFYYEGRLVHTIYQDQMWSAAAYVHHNFGWSGTDNGWYSSGSMYWEFDTDVEIITGIRPR